MDTLDIYPIGEARDGGDLIHVSGQRVLLDAARFMARHRYCIRPATFDAPLASDGGLGRARKVTACPRSRESGHSFIVDPLRRARYFALKTHPSVA